MLLIDNSITQLERILVDTISTAYKIRKLTLSDIVSLRKVQTIGISNTPTFIDDDLVYVTSKTNIYVWKQASVLTDDGDLIIKPNDATTGRWLKVISNVTLDGINIATIPSGILKAVVLHNGDFDEAVLKSRIYGLAPCVAIHFAGEEHVPISQIPGALYDYRVKFEIWSVSRNFRDKYEASLGSDLPSEYAEDPGVLHIHGLVKKLLAGRTGEQYSETSIKYTELSGGDLEMSEEAERVFVMNLRTEVWASIHNPDAPAELVSVGEIDIQRYISQADSNTKIFDLNNCLNTGLTVSLGPFASNVSSGTATIASLPVSVSTTSFTFPASSDTYRDLTPVGTWVFTSVSNNQTPSSPTAGNLRVGVTVTDAANIIFDTILTSIYQPYPAAATPDVVIV